MVQRCWGDADMSAADQSLLIAENVTISLAGFGCAIYGCIVSRQLRRRLRRHEEMGPYVLKQLLGSGGMGVVYLAEHRLLNRLCAIKLIRRDRQTSRRLIRCFADEVNATARLTHCNTVQIYDYGSTRTGSFYYVMEYLPGLNLRQLVDGFGPLPPGRVVYILKQICGALHEASLHGLVHRDIKPSNIFLAERGQMFDVAKLLDFGLVRPACEQGIALRNASTQLQGSPRYMCPEQARGLSPDCRGDLYSLGCVAYFLLTGRPPFDEPNPVRLVLAHAATSVPTFEEIGVEVPADLGAVILKCLSKQPEDRYDSPRELLAALETCHCGRDWTWREAELWWKELAACDKLPMSHRPETAEETGSLSPFDREHVPDDTLLCQNQRL